MESIIPIPGGILGESTPIENSKKVLEWFCNNSVESFENGKKYLSQRLDKELEKAFGNPNTRIRLEFNTKIWQVQYGDQKYVILTSERGTSIEILGHHYLAVSNGTLNAKIIEFLEELYKQLTNEDKF